MGDMKTPDFDDLLAAFDIPDINAQEAIQSNPEEQRDEPRANAPPSEPPVVSVIVKNTGRSESVEEKPVKDKTDDSSDGVLTSPIPAKLDPTSHDAPTPQLGPKTSPSSSMDSEMMSRFEDQMVCNRTPCLPQLWASSPSNSPSEQDEEPESRPSQRTSKAADGLRPLLYSQSSKSADVLLPPPLLQSQARHPQDSQSSSTVAQNGNMDTEIKRVINMDEEDSEPDIGSPLVIQEGPECVTSPLLNNKTKLHSDLFEHPGNASSLVPDPPKLSFSSALTQSKSQSGEGGRSSPVFTQHGKDGTPTSPNSSTSDPPPQKAHHSPFPASTNSTVVQENLYPEHVIDERDSPESPPPSETGCLLTNQSSSSDVAALPGSASSNKESSHQQQELKEAESSQDDKPGRRSEEVAGDGDEPNKENCSADTKDTTSSCATETASFPLRPLKVKIKMPTGSITRTVTGGASKRSVKGSAKSVDNSKNAQDGLSARSKKELAPQSEFTETLQETIREESSVETKPKVSATAVSITKTAALPSISSARVGAGALNLRSLGQKTLNTGMTLPSTLPALPTQASGRPASIVNSTGAIISKNQSNLVEAFNKILNNKNLLPTYKPELSSPLPAEWGISLPAQGYRCLECGDAFALEQSLAQHYDRRSLRIEVTCNHCAKRLAFFNKCSLLLHAREHKERGLIMQCSHLVMKPVPVDLMISQPEAAKEGWRIFVDWLFFCFKVSPTLLYFTPLGSSPSVLGQATSKLWSLTGKGAEAAPNTSIKCPECQAQFSSKEELADHFQEVKAAHSTSCTECSPTMLLPNHCSSAAHQRFHQGSQPHVCPECGLTLKQPLFQKHLYETCLHFSRRVGYRCSSCLVVFGGLNSVKSHIQQAHCDVFHKCPSCPMAFKSAPSVQSHINTQHPDLTEGQTLLIYKCVMCDTVFTYKHVLHTHFDTHLTNQRVQVFKCPECNKLFSQRHSMLEHFKTHKTVAIKEELVSPASASFKSSEGEGEPEKGMKRKVKAERIKAPSGWKCHSCNLQFMEKEDYINHMSKQHGKTLKKFPCNKCESSFTTTSSMRRHIRDKHKILSRGFRCQFCCESKKTFSSRAMLERHIELRHGVDSLNQDGGTRGYEADSSSEQDSVRSRRKRRGVKVEHDEDSTHRMSPAKKLRSCAPSESVFSCAPCGFSTDVQAAFQEHISQHRQSAAESTGLQCLQCGACFTSSSSLSRHRFISHKVKDASGDGPQSLGGHPAPSPGNTTNPSDRSHLNGSAPASPSNQPSTGQGKDEEGGLACKVCGKHFEKTSDLNTHFRTHGMAFIIARNAGKTI
ncbi:Zinc finger protein 687 [Oryzias melastigma]|uniref:Zinc finger protein 687 n=1 Tax=Oryzias melastigma TaxID=30732 RepID=A0A834FT35_ORYME|nr:Zinc finger protein 687 [Oryzias melastigma]